MQTIRGIFIKTTQKMNCRLKEAGAKYNFINWKILRSVQKFSAPF